MNPGARDTPGDAIDDDCDGTAAPFARLGARLSLSFWFVGRSTKVTRLQATDVPPGTTVVVRCTARGRGCPFNTKRFTTNGNGKLAMTRAVKRRLLPPGIRLEVSLTHTDAIGTWTRFVIRARKAPLRSDRCIPPNQTRPSAC